MNSLINWAGVRRRTNKYGSLPVYISRFGRIRVVALKMNKEFGTTITVPSIVNQYGTTPQKSRKTSFVSVEAMYVAVMKPHRL